MAYNIKQNDTSPSLSVQLLDGAQQIIDLSGASAKFFMKIAGSTTIAVDAPAVITNASEGRVEYEWSAGDTAIAANYQGEFQITFINGTVETFPNNKYITIRVLPEIG